MEELMNSPQSAHRKAPEGKNVTEQRVKEEKCWTLLVFISHACAHTHNLWFVLFFCKLVESPAFSHCNKKLCYNKDFSHLPFVVTRDNSPSFEEDAIIVLPFYQHSTEHFYLSTHG